MMTTVGLGSVGAQPPLRVRVLSLATNSTNSLTCEPQILIAKNSIESQAAFERSCICFQSTAGCLTAAVVAAGVNFPAAGVNLDGSSRQCRPPSSQPTRCRVQEHSAVLKFPRSPTKVGKATWPADWLDQRVRRGRRREEETFARVRESGLLTRVGKP